MVNNSLSHQIKRHATPIRIGILLFSCILFAIIIILDYTHGIKHGDLLGSIIYAIPLPWSLGGSFLLFTMNRNKSLKVPVPWHKQYVILLGLLLLGMSPMYLVMIANTLMNNSLPDVIAWVPIGIGGLAILLVFVRIVILRWSNTGAE